jgi:hypothetical protein
MNLQAQIEALYAREAKEFDEEYFRVFDELKAALNKERVRTAGLDLASSRHTDLSYRRAFIGRCLAFVGVSSSAAEVFARASDAGLTLTWDKNLLAIHEAKIPGGRVEINYLEAYCRSGSTHRRWEETVIPHRTKKLEAPSDGKFIKLLCRVEGGVEVQHEIRAGQDEVRFQVTAVNRGPAYVDAVWVQPCIRLGPFMGRSQQDYIERSFIFVGGKATPLDQTRRTTEAIYKGGQVYVPAGIGLADVNPRPISPDVPSNGLIGCFSADDRYILATAWEPYQELFQGINVCLHSDFRLGGLNPGETKTARGRIYLIKNDPEELLRRFRRDFESRK